MPPLVQYTYYLSPISAHPINDGVGISADDLMTGPFTHPFGADQRIALNDFRSGLDRGEHPISGSEAELCVVCFNGGDILYRPR